MPATIQPSKDDDLLWRPSSKLNFSLDPTRTLIGIQQLRTAGSVPRNSALSPRTPTIPAPQDLSLPRHVMNVRIATKFVGTQKQVTVLFNRNPVDPVFGKVVIWLKGYRGNKKLVSIAQGQDSPISFMLDRTGEPVSVVVQASGSSGDAFLYGSPNKTLKLG